MSEYKDDNLIIEVKELWEKLKDGLDASLLKQLNITQLERILLRLENYSENCERCFEFLRDLLEDGQNIMDHREQIDKKLIKHHTAKIHEITNHLQNKHKLVSEGQNLSIYMPLGLSLGVVFGTLSDYIPIGISVGMMIGVVIGNYLDYEARKKGNVI